MQVLEAHYYVYTYGKGKLGIFRTFNDEVFTRLRTNIIKNIPSEEWRHYGYVRHFQEFIDEKQHKYEDFKLHGPLLLQEAINLMKPSLAAAIKQHDTPLKLPEPMYAIHEKNTKFERASYMDVVTSVYLRKTIDGIYWDSIGIYVATFGMIATRTDDQYRQICDIFDPKGIGTKYFTFEQIVPQVEDAMPGAGSALLKLEL